MRTLSIGVTKTKQQGEEHRRPARGHRRRARAHWPIWGLVAAVWLLMAEPAVAQDVPSAQDVPDIGGTVPGDVSGRDDSLSDAGAGPEPGGPSAQGQDGGDDVDQALMALSDADSGEVILIVGSYSKLRTVVDSPVAIDLLDAEELATESGYSDLNRALHYVAPSFNATRQSGSDGADHIDPATLRGLGPDQTLVLINGKRRHPASLINIFGSRGRGNTGTDLGAIPLAAIERIEVLRDGASALYGSDAIAGVINIVLKSDVDRLDAWVGASTHYAKPPSDIAVDRGQNFDGEAIQASGNYGYRVGDRGFVNVTLDYRRQNRTSRAADPAEFTNYRREFGDAAMTNFSAFANAELEIGNVEIYAFGGHNYRDTNAYAWTREADSERNVSAIYPDGFDPRITSRITDTSVSVGARTRIGAWRADLNNTFGVNRFHYIIEDTLNASLLERSPTRFDAGGHELSQNVTGIHLARPVPSPLYGLHVAVGGEFRIDNYRLFAGEEGSYRNYGIMDQVVDGEVVSVDTLGRPGGSQGFPGFQPDNEVDEVRSNLAAYADVSADLSRAWMVSAAGRFEEYSDFGQTINARLASRLELARLLPLPMDNLVMRSSVSTGFRAPSLPQIYYNTTFTDFVGGEAIDKIIAKNDSPVTRALGIPRLSEETSINASVGIAAVAGHFKLTVDGYYVNIRDRIVLTGAFDSEDPDIGEDLRALEVGAAQFFANALDTRTLGLDVVLDGRYDLGAHVLRGSLAGNFNRMRLGDLEVSEPLMGKEDIFFGRREEKFLLASAPRSKLSLTLGHTYGPVFSSVRLVRFDEVVLIDWLDTEDVYEAKITTDVNAGWRLSDSLTLVVGGSNIFNVYPTQQDTETESGGLWDSVQMGSSGAYYYAKLNARM